MRFKVESLVWTDNGLHAPDLGEQPVNVLEVAFVIGESKRYLLVARDSKVSKRNEINFIAIPKRIIRERCVICDPGAVDGDFNCRSVIQMLTKSLQDNLQALK